MQTRVAQNVVMRYGVGATLVGAFATPPTAGIIGPTPRVKLFTGNITLTPFTLLADLTAIESNFGGYSFATPETQVGTATIANGIIGLIWSAMFSTNDTGAGAVINGYWLEGGTPFDWIVAEQFAQPVALGGNFNPFLLTVVAPVSILFRIPP